MEVTSLTPSSIDTIKTGKSAKEVKEAKAKDKALKKAKHPCPFPGCKKSFDSKWGLNRHHRIHTGLKPFTCQECGKAFVEKCAMVRHMRTHQESKPYKCDFPGCSKEFKCKEYLYVHRHIHSQSRKYVCNIESCGKTYLTAKGLKKHTKEIHQSANNKNFAPGTKTEQSLRERLVKMGQRHRRQVAKMKNLNQNLKTENSNLRMLNEQLQQRLMMSGSGLNFEIPTAFDPSPIEMQATDYDVFNYDLDVITGGSETSGESDVDSDMEETAMGLAEI